MGSRSDLTEAPVQERSRADFGSTIGRPENRLSRMSLHLEGALDKLIHLHILFASQDVMCDYFALYFLFCL